MTVRDMRQYGGAALSCAVSVMLLSLVVMTGWYGGWVRIVQPVPGGAIMQFNTALCLFCLGATGLATLMGLRRASLVFAAIPIILGSLTLLEYVFSLDFGLDQFFVRAHVTHPTNPPGRMAPNSAISMIVCGGVGFTLALGARSLRTLFVAQALSAAVLTMGVSALVGHVLNLAPLAGWYGLTHMAPHSALGLVLVAIVFIYNSYAVMSSRQTDLRAYTPWLVLAIGVVFSIVAWQSVLADRVAKWEIIARSEVEELSQQTQYFLGQHKRSMGRLVARWDGISGFEERDRRLDARAYVADWPGIFAVAFCNESGEIEWVEPRELGDAAALLTASPVRDAMVLSAREGSPVLSRSSTLESGRSYFSIAVPSIASPAPGGAFVGIFDVAESVSQLIADVERGQYVFRIWEDGTPIFRSAPDSTPAVDLLSVRVGIEESGLQWELEAVPTRLYYDQTASNLAAVVFFLGLLMTGALSWSLRERGTALRLAGAHAAALTDLSREVVVRERAQEELMEREEHIRNLLQSTAEAIYGIDNEGRCTFCNRACIQILGLGGEEDLLGRNVHDLIHHSHPDGSHYEREKCRIHLACQLNQGIHVDTEVFWRLDGNSFPVEYWSYPVTRNDEVVGAVVTFMDISARKAAQEALRASEERFDLAVRGASDGLWDWDMESNTVWYSDRYRELVGYRDGTPAADDSDSFFNMLHPDDLEATRDALRKHIKEYVPYDIECRLRNGEGEYRWFHVRGTCIRSAGGQPTRMAGSLQDVTERHRLMREVGEVNKRLLDRSRELEHRSQEVEAFVYTVSHDLRGLLVNIQGFSRELAHSCKEIEELYGPNPPSIDVEKRRDEVIQEEIPDALHYISAGTTKLEHLIDALLRLSRTGRQAYRIEILDVAALVESTVDARTKLIEAADAEVIVGDLPDTYGDRTALEQVFGNLIGNALNYLRPGVPGRIEVGGEGLMEDGTCHYWVGDNGIGIESGAYERIFQVFHRMHPAMCDGDGMGLTIIKRVVERLGGEVWVESEVGVGSVFHFTIAAKPDKAQQKQRKESVTNVN